MYVRVEPTGCCERRGLVQVRFCMYLDTDDYGYERHHIQAPVIPEGGYTGGVDVDGMPTKMRRYQKWLDKLPKVWQCNPFHNHYIHIKPETSDEEIMDIGLAFLEEAYIKWACGEKIDLKNPCVYHREPNTEGIAIKVQHLRETFLERKYGR